MDYTYRDLIKEPPEYKELKRLAIMGQTNLKGLVNTRSQAFKKLKPQLAELDEKEVAELIKQEPRIMVRPVLVVGEKLVAGFKEDQYQELLV